MIYTLRSSTSSDFNFLRLVHHRTLREHVERIWGWDEKVQDQMFADGVKFDRVQVIEVDGQAGGYLELNREEEILHIANVLLLPEFQGRGIGSEIIRDLLSKHDHVRLGVFKVNSGAKRLYESLGFETYQETQTHYLMQLRR